MASSWRSVDDIRWDTNHSISTGFGLGFSSECKSAIKELHRYALHHPHELDALLASMFYLLVGHLGPHNMLGKANRSLTKRLLGSSADESQVWLRLIECEGDVTWPVSSDQ
jgi:hypothetical protein